MLRQELHSCVLRASPGKDKNPIRHKHGSYPQDAIGIRAPMKRVHSGSHTQAAKM